MSFIVDRIREISVKDESREVYLLDRKAVKDARNRIQNAIKEADYWTEEFHERLRKYIDAIIIKSMCDSWDLIDNEIDLDCLRLTLAVYQKKLTELDEVLSEKLKTE